MWLDRFSNHSTPSASPPPGRTSFQGGRRPSYQSHGGPLRPSAFSPRSSSLNVSAKLDASTSSSNSPRLLPNGSSLRQEVAPSPDFSNPLAVLEEIIGQKLHVQAEGVANDSGKGDGVKPGQLLDDIDFRGKSLVDFAEEEQEEPAEIAHLSSSTAEECEYVKLSFSSKNID